MDFFLLFWRLKFIKSTILRTPKMAKTLDLEPVDSAKLISRKILLTEKSRNFYTVQLWLNIIKFQTIWDPISLEDSPLKSKVSGNMTWSPTRLFCLKALFRRCSHQRKIMVKTHIAAMKANIKQTSVKAGSMWLIPWRRIKILHTSWRHSIWFHIKKILNFGGFFFNFCQLCITTLREISLMINHCFDYRKNEE